MYLQMLCNTLKAVSLPSVPKARESLEAEVIVSAQPAREWFHRQKDNEGSPEQLPSQCHSGEGFFKDFFQGLLLLFQADFLWLC